MVECGTDQTTARSRFARPPDCSDCCSSANQKLTGAARGDKDKCTRTSAILPFPPRSGPRTLRESSLSLDSSLVAAATSTMTCDQSKPGLPDLRTTNGAPYFILSEGCFAATACCFFWFAAFALICFCAACLCTDFGDLSPIISLPFGFWFADPRHVHFSTSD